MPALPTITDLNTVYGSTNIDEWSDSDNDGDVVKKAARVTWAIENAYLYIIGRLNKRFDTTTWVSYPAIVFKLIAKRAGIELYSSPRGLVDGDAATAQLNARSLEIEAQLDQILSGQLQIVDLPVAPTDCPGVNNGGDPFREINSRSLQWSSTSQAQWTGEPCVIPNGNFYQG